MRRLIVANHRIITKTLLRGLQKGFYHPAELMMARDSSGTI